MWNQHPIERVEVVPLSNRLEVLMANTLLSSRFMNREVLEPMWNQHQIERVEVVMKETVTCEGKINSVVCGQEASEVAVLEVESKMNCSEHFVLPIGKFLPILIQNWGLLY